jgi:hypothetical protein
VFDVRKKVEQESGRRRYGVAVLDDVAPPIDSLLYWCYYENLHIVNVLLEEETRVSVKKKESSVYGGNKRCLLFVVQRSIDRVMRPENATPLHLCYPGWYASVLV